MGLNAHASKVMADFSGRTLLFLGFGLFLCLTTLSTTLQGYRGMLSIFRCRSIVTMTNRFRRFSENSRGGFSGNRSTLLRPSFFWERSFTRFWPVRSARFRIAISRATTPSSICFEAKDGSPDFGKKHDKLLFRAQLFYFMGEVEAVFGVWLIPLFIAIIAFHGWSTMVDYVGNVNVADAIFCCRDHGHGQFTAGRSFYGKRDRQSFCSRKGNPRFVVVGNSDPRPIARFLHYGAGGMTICALLLRHRFYSLKPSERLKYATLGLLFVNISVGGVFTQFGSPPVVIAASAWNWDLAYMLTHFGWKAVIGIILSNLLYLTVFRREFARLATNVPDEEQDQEGRRPIPWRITVIHILFLCWTVANAHYPVLVILGFLFFLAFVSATRLNQHAIALRPPLLVGFFLAALIIHGGCQQWWIGPVLGTLSKWPLMLAATILTAFNDNAAITYLASLVPGFSDALKYVVMAGAVTGGGLTVIANSPNPAGQSILASRFGEAGISPLYLFLGALVPTLIAGAAFMLLP